MINHSYPNKSHIAERLPLALMTMMMDLLPALMPTMMGPLLDPQMVAVVVALASVDSSEGGVDCP